MNTYKRYIVMVAVVFIMLWAALTVVLVGMLVVTNNEIDKANTLVMLRDSAIQRFDEKIGMAESKLLTSKKLEEKYKEEIKEIKKKLILKTKNRKVAKLQIDSAEETVVKIDNSVTGGVTKVTVVENSGRDTGKICDDKILSYSWSDTNNRFHLSDPDIASSGDETFKYSQYFKINGTVLTDSTGDLKVKNISVVEMIRKKRADGSYFFKKVVGGKFTLIDSKFDYANNKQSDKGIVDILTFRPLFLFDTGVMPGIGVELLNLGNYIDYFNIGVYGKVAFDLTSPLSGSLQESRVGVGLLYHIVPPILPTNFAVGLSVTTPINNIGKVVLTADFILYLTEDLNPFEWWQK